MAKNHACATVYSVRTSEYCRELVFSKPEERKVNRDLTIDFGGRKYDVRNVPFVLVCENMTVAA
ncbi:hypothetical protein [Kingella kingae]|uniref:hypothetical protein n=1 Tax=Kingella kingae TaxID=504 RepID=UPI00040D7162|nr:hypothetical protein [Kingella kingae]